MKLLVKFNLIYILVMALGVGVSGWISRNLLVAKPRTRCSTTCGC